MTATVAQQRKLNPRDLVPNSDLGGHNLCAGKKQAWKRYPGRLLPVIRSVQPYLTQVWGLEDQRRSCLGGSGRARSSNDSSSPTPNSKAGRCWSTSWKLVGDAGRLTCDLGWGWGQVHRLYKLSFSTIE